MATVLLKILVLLSSAALSLYLAAMAFLYFRQEALLFFPDPEAVQPANAFRDFDTVFELNGQILDGWFIPGETATTLVYYGGNADELSRQLDDIPQLAPFNYLLINYRGYGESSGVPGEQALKQDARAILAAASERYGFNIDDTVVMGRSLGSGVATYIASVFQLKALVLVTPYDSVRAVAQARYPIFPVSWLIRHPFDSLAYLDAIDEPALILKAESDAVVPHQHTDNLVARWQGPLTVATVPGNHGNIMSSPEFKATVSSFLADIDNENPFDEAGL